MKLETDPKQNTAKVTFDTQKEVVDLIDCLRETLRRGLRTGWPCSIQIKASGTTPK